MKICYVAADYQSYQRPAKAYRDILQERFELVESIAQAGIVILHADPPACQQFAKANPILKQKYVIGYLVWEATELPEAYQSFLGFCQEIWTPSQYCHAVFAKHHPQVLVIPHIIERDRACAEGDREYVHRAISYEPDCFYFLTVTKLRDKRKNTQGLVRVFASLAAVMPQARLIVKMVPGDPVQDLPQDPCIIPLAEYLTDAQMNALYELSSAYASPHHSEGWGLTLPDAMMFGLPVIATGYSGNLDYMNEQNSFLLGYEEKVIRREDQFFLFDGGMKWAYPDEEELKEMLLLLYKERGNPAIQKKVMQAAQDIQRFNRDAIAEIIQQRLNEIVRVYRCN